MGGIGVGVFEEADDDIFEADDMMQYDRVMVSADASGDLRPSFRSSLNREQGEPQLAIKAGPSSSFSGPSPFELEGYVAASGQIVPRKVRCRLRRVRPPSVCKGLTVSVWVGAFAALLPGPE
jgi:hypothetical protein